MSHDTPFDYFNAAQEQAEANARAEHEKRVEDDDMRWLMSNKRGRRIALRLLEQAGVYRHSFNTDIAVMSFNEGRRDSGLRLLKLITTVCPDRYNEMLAEKNERDKRA